MVLLFFSKQEKTKQKQENRVPFQFCFVLLLLYTTYCIDIPTFFVSCFYYIPHIVSLYHLSYVKHISMLGINIASCNYIHMWSIEIQLRKLKQHTTVLIFKDYQPISINLISILQCSVQYIPTQLCQVLQMYWSLKYCFLLLLSFTESDTEMKTRFELFPDPTVVTP